MSRPTYLLALGLTLSLLTGCASSEGADTDASSADAAMNGVTDATESPAPSDDAESPGEDAEASAPSDDAHDTEPEEDTQDPEPQQDTQDPEPEEDVESPPEDAGPSDATEAPPECADGDTQSGTTPCGETGQGVLLQECIAGAWADTATCEGEPEQGPELKVGETPCGPESEGTVVQELIDEVWTDTSLCLVNGPREYDQLNLLAGYHSSEWDYEQATFPAKGLYGWSYYIRAFDLLRDTPVQEVGWGQWSKPSMPADGLDVCGVHPHGFVCDEEAPSATDMAGELQGCGYTDYESMEGCSVWCCAEEDKCGVRGSIEGGMGYWMYTLETPQVKWMLPGATNANYEIFGGTFLNDREQPCVTLGGAVRIANTFVIPNDFVSFADDTVNGFLGYMLSRTPIGKRSETDDANYWTILIDAGNFSGPVMYMSSWFWDSRINWHPESVSWSDPRALVGYVAQGFEGRIGGIQVVDDDGVTWRRTNRWAFPKDLVNGAMKDTSTLFTGHSQYNTDWAVEAMEPMLSGTGEPEAQTAAAIKAKALSERQAPGGGCNLPDPNHAELRLEMETEDGEVVWQGFGVKAPDATGAAQAATDAAHCHTRLDLDPSKLDCDATEGWCEGHRYIKLNADGTAPAAIPSAEVPLDIKAALELRAFEGTRKNDGSFLGPPAETEQACFDTPGPAPADPRLYCTRTKSGNWLGFRWYRFVDQPELNQVFASLPEDERDAAKCFMQARIERLHAAQQSGDELPRWFDAPQGEAALPGTKVDIDPALLVTPPVGMEVGFVPIPVYERKRTKPLDCEVTIGSHQEEPDPLPEDYYEGFYTHSGGYDIEWCPANSESGEAFSYPGTVFGYAPGGDQSERVPYQAPTRGEVGSSLSETAVVCGLPSDPPASDE
ncbi:MAG: hypothetical protein ACPGU1_15745 [Myxococcota bacterium]